MLATQQIPSSLAVPALLVLSEDMFHLNPEMLMNLDTDYFELENLEDANE